MCQVDLAPQQLPEFFCPSTAVPSQVGAVSQLQSNCQRVIKALAVHGTRNLMIVFDDTVFWPSYSLASFDCNVL